MPRSIRLYSVQLMSDKIHLRIGHEGTEVFYFFNLGDSWGLVVKQKDGVTPQNRYTRQGSQKSHSLPVIEPQFLGLPACSLRKGKGKVHSRKGHEGPKGEQKDISILSLTSALDGVGGQRHPSADLPPGMTRYPLYRRRGRPKGRSGRVRKISPPTGVRSPHSTARSESLYRLSYPGSL